MSKNGQKETINISFFNKNKELEDKSKQNESNNINKNNNTPNSSKADKNENLPKIIMKKENNTNNNDSSNNILNKKRERTQSHIKEQEEEPNNIANNLSKKKMPLNEAKKEMKDFELLIFNTEKEIQKKHGFVFPDLSFEDNLPDEIKNKLIDNFLELPNIKKILTEANAQK